MKRKREERCKGVSILMHPLDFFLHLKLMQLVTNTKSIPELFGLTMLYM